jgi:hypothetical protein
MSSGIFYKAGLKSRPFSKNNLDYRIYFFRELVSFILHATSYITKEKPEVYLLSYNSVFDRVINQMTTLKWFVLDFN